MTTATETTQTTAPRVDELETAQLVRRMAEALAGASPDASVSVEALRIAWDIVRLNRRLGY